ncbi:MAG: helix-turn-helix domain-containing protein [Crocinitomicaceae bacterium]
MKYSKIENKKQYKEYTAKHLELGNTLAAGKGNGEMEDEYYILDLIIEDYHSKQKHPFEKLTPVDLLKALMRENDVSGYRLSKELGISQSVISDILNYKRGFSKEVIRKLAKKFSIGEQSFLKEYELINKESNVA